MIKTWESRLRKNLRRKEPVCKQCLILSVPAVRPPCGKSSSGVKVPTDSLAVMRDSCPATLHIARLACFALCQLAGRLQCSWFWCWSKLACSLPRWRSQVCFLKASWWITGSGYDSVITQLWALLFYQSVSVWGSPQRHTASTTDFVLNKWPDGSGSTRPTCLNLTCKLLFFSSIENLQYQADGKFEAVKIKGHNNPARPFFLTND